MDVFNLVGIELWLKLGCTPNERVAPQRVEMDVRWEGNFSVAGRSDDLKRSIDYAAVVKGLRRALSRKPRRLMEAVAEDAARHFLRSTTARSVTIRLRKRALPGICYAEVEIQRADAR